MATLTETAYYTRAFIKYGAILIVFLILARITWVVGTNIYLSFFPPDPPAPTVAFGKLPPLPFPEDPPVPLPNITLQTPEGVLPNFPTQVFVYFMPQATSSLLALDEATELAQDIGFDQNRHLLSETIYRFDKGDTPSYLDINIVNKTFSFNFDLTQTPELLSLRPHSTAEALQGATNMLQSGGIYTDDLENGNKTFEFLKIQGGELIGVPSLSEAQFVKVNFFRSNYASGVEGELDTLPVLTTDKKNANVWFIISGDTSRDRQIIAGEYHYFTVDTKRNSTYPLKTAAQAWEELKSGQGYLASALQDKAAQVVIRRVYLAYYDSGRPQEFLQPIVVFEGDGGFIGYVPAVSSEYYSRVALPTPEPLPAEPATEEGQVVEEATPSGQ